MEDLNKPILDQIIQKGFPQVEELDYKFTEYSLNSDFSFKFESLQHFVAFLQQKAEISDEQITLLETALKDVNLDIHSFFFVNFFENKESEFSK